MQCRASVEGAKSRCCIRKTPFGRKTEGYLRRKVGRLSLERRKGVIVIEASSLEEAKLLPRRSGE